MIPLGDMTLAADSVAANGTAGGLAEGIAHAPATVSDALSAVPSTLTATFPQVEPLSAAERALTLGGWLSDWSERIASGVSTAADATVAELFGTASTLAESGQASGSMPTLLSGSWVYQAVVLLLAAAYLLLFYTNYSEVRMLIDSFGIDRNAGQRAMEKRGVIHSHFLRRCCVLGVAGAGVLTVRLCDSLLPAGAFDALSPLWWQGFCVAAVLAIEAVVLVQTIALWTIGQVTLTQSFVSTLLYVNQFHFALATLTALPLVLLYALCPIGSGSGWLYLILVLTAIIILLFLREIHSLFVAKNISNLHWILYLCTIEIAPVAFAVLMLVKHS